MNDIISQGPNALIFKEEEEPSVDQMLAENARRMAKINAPFNPMTGEASIGKRKHVRIFNFPQALYEQWLPVEMMDVPLVKMLTTYGLDLTVKKVFGGFTPEGRDAVLDQFLRIRYKYDFPFWCWMCVKIKPKDYGADIPFRLNYPQRRLVEVFENRRKRRKPIRVVLLKARQWGGSTVTQIYIAWMQLVHLKGANSLIVGHVKDASTEVKDMFFKLIDQYPVDLLTTPDDPNLARILKMPKIHGTSSSANLFYIDSRNCKLKLGTAEKPESARGGDSTLVHCTEVAMWMETDGKKPEDIVRSAISGTSYKPNTMVVYESTAAGMENFFHDQYAMNKEAEEAGKPHQFDTMFVSWYEIGWKNMIPFQEDEGLLKAAVLSRHGVQLTDEMRDGSVTFSAPWYDPYLLEEIPEDSPSIRDFAQQLIDKRKQQNAELDIEEPGRYLWWLWEKGATLQAIYWYILERTKHHEHADMASEAPSDDIEAFKHSGSKVFSEYYIHELEKGCKPPKYIGEVEATMMVTADEFNRYRHRPNSAFNGRSLISNLQFVKDDAGSLWVWELPETFADCKITNRYIVSVDIGGMSNKADWSVITVLDRYWLTEGSVPTVVAQWRGHIDHDVLAIKSAQIAAFYHNALLVIESNTLETRDKDRDVDGDQSGFILDQIKEFYPNLYEREADSDSILSGAAHKYGFHTNTKTKPLLIANLQKVIRDGLYVERDKRCLAEYMVYQKMPNGSFSAPKGYHDDMLMSRAIALYISYTKMEYPRVIENKPKELTTGRKPQMMSAAIM